MTDEPQNAIPGIPSRPSPMGMNGLASLPAMPCGPFALPGARRVPSVCVGTRATPFLPATGGHARAFDDIMYFAMQAEHQLARITEFLEADAVARSLPEHMHPHMTSIGGICRALDRVLEDIRTTAHAEARRESAPQPV